MGFFLFYEIVAQKEKIAKGERDIRSTYADLDEWNDQIELLSFYENV